jgi:hypothetical protein
VPPSSFGGTLSINGAMCAIFIVVLSDAPIEMNAPAPSTVHALVIG